MRSSITRKADTKLATGMRLVREVPPQNAPEMPTTKIPVRYPRDVFILMEPFAAEELTEVFWLLPLDSQHKTTGPIVVSRGTLNSSLVSPREVFIRAVVSSAAAIIVCHNHPSGDPTPSPDDRVVTDQLIAAGKVLDIPVQDHIIVGLGRYVSFAESGLM